MSNPFGLKILADTNNVKGDMLTRLVTDVFHSLGYEEFHLNVHKSGREIDISAVHRHENRILIAECKAQGAPVGGSDINKFAGALDAERNSGSTASIIGYFVSISGFTETAIEQERSLSSPRMILLDGPAIAKALVDGRIVVPPIQAAEIAGRYVNEHDLQLQFQNQLDLVGSPIGWLWSVNFADASGQPVACLVHADGQIVAKSAADVVTSLMEKKLLLREGVFDTERLTVFRGRYAAYLSDEYGNITLEGMPADQHVGSRSFKLEDLYVPLDLVDLDEHSSEDSALRTVKSRQAAPGGNLREQPLSQADQRRPIGEVLSGRKRIAILGPPGAGKTTILKRLCMAFSDAERLSASDDNLPNYEAFPLVIRCRQLGQLVTQPIGRILDDVIQRAEMREYADIFRTYLGDHLRLGSAIVLVDGLDEISDPSDRAQFVAQLRTFVGQYPQLRVVVTSREVGFRVVAGSIGSICKTYRVGELSDAGITHLTVRWHREVLGPRPDVERDAEELAASILSTDRVRRLAVNPLLLTTLLLVRRWIGQLPRRRSVLYQKAIEVLLMTWNVEGHEPIDPEEALPQLAFAAYRMMLEGQADVSASELARLFGEARSSVPEVLAYAKTSVHDFLKRVEERSSLLVQSGQRVENGALVWVYEFKHLTFQEYLCALAIVKGYLPTGTRSTEPARLLGARVKDPRWREVVALTAVLSERTAGNITDHLMLSLQRIENRREKDIQAERRTTHKTYEKRVVEQNAILGNLIACLSDEVNLAPAAVTKAIQFVVGVSQRPWVRESAISDLVKGLSGGRYDSILRDLVRKNMVSGDGTKVDYFNVMAELIEFDSTKSAPTKRATLAKLNGSSPYDEICGTLIVMMSAFHLRYPKNAAARTWNGKIRRKSIVDLAKEVALRYQSSSEGESDHLCFVRVWAIAWAIPLLADEVNLVNAVQQRLLVTWQRRIGSQLSDFAAWALRASPLVGSWNDRTDKKELRKFIENAQTNTMLNRHHEHQAASVLVAFYARLYDDKTLGEIAIDVQNGFPEMSISVERILEIVGRPN